ncbi:hypothetical protein Bbelb_233850 [Branchiostoma belcheri]|nr:hypothetical protein Bbelb_233850 [Branchiostoma belcheri]
MNDSNSSGLACLTDGPVAPATRRYTLGTTVVLSVLVSITVLLSITGNIFICVAVTSERKLRSVHNRLPGRAPVRKFDLSIRPFRNKAAEFCRIYARPPQECPQFAITYIYATLIIALSLHRQKHEWILEDDPTFPSNRRLGMKDARAKAEMTGAADRHVRKSGDPATSICQKTQDRIFPSLCLHALTAAAISGNHKSFEATSTTLSKAALGRVYISIDRYTWHLREYLVSLAVSDLMVGLVIMPPALVTELLGYWFFGEALCGVFLAVDIFACTASIINLCAISLDRYWSVARPADYRRQGLSRKRVRLAIVAVWVTSAAICLPSLVGWTNDMYIDDQQRPQCEYTNNIGYVVYSTVGSFYLPLVIMTVAYVRVCWAVKDRILRNQRRKMIPLKTLNGNNKRKEAAIAEGVSGNICHTTDEKDSDEQLEEGLQEGENRNVLTVPPDGVRRTAGRSRHQQQSGGTELQHGGNTRLLCCRKESDPDENTKSTTERTQKSTQRCCAENGKEKQTGPNNLLLSAVVLHEKSLLSFSVSSATTSSLPKPHRPGDCSKLEKRLSLPELRDTKIVDQPQSGVRPEGNTRSMEYMVIVHPPPSAEEPNQQEAPPPPTSKSLTTTPKKKVNMLSPHVRKQRDCRRRIEIEHDLEDLTSTFSNIAHNDLIIKDEKELSKLHRLVHCHNPNVLRKRLMGNRDRRLIVVVGIIMSVFVLCWLPFFLTYVVQTACGSCDVPEPLFKFFTWLGYCNSSLNPVLYTIFNRDFRKVFYKKILRRELAK